MTVGEWLKPETANPWWPFLSDQLAAEVHGETVRVLQIQNGNKPDPRDREGGAA